MRALSRLGPLLACGMLAAGCMPVDQASEAGLAVGKAAQEISGTDADGGLMKLNDFRGKVVLLDFWQTN